MVIRVNVADVRPRLTDLLRGVENDGEKVIVARYGNAVAALVPMADLRRIWAEEDEERYGQINPETGLRRGPLIRAKDVLRGLWG